MFNQQALNTHINNRLGIPNGEAMLPKAASLFEKAYRSPDSFMNKLLRRESQHLLSLADVRACCFTGNQYYGGSQVVAVEAIRGTVDKQNDFDAEFHPTQRHSENRWRKVASAMLNGKDLPPVELIQVGDTYYVQDGHHRVSVARALGYGYVDAIVTVWDVDNCACDIHAA